MKLTSESKLLLGILGSTILIILGAVFLFSKPAPAYTRQELISADTNTEGNKDATNYLVEFSDFQCPACKVFSATVNDIVKKYGDKLYFAYHHYPLPQHAFSVKASVAAEAAGAQGKFWEMHDLLFANQDSLSDAKVTELAKQLNLNMDQFTASLADPKLKAKIDTDKALGDKINLQATPTFYLNGKKLNLATPDDLIQAVDAVMK